MVRQRCWKLSDGKIRKLNAAVIFFCSAIRTLIRHECTRRFVFRYHIFSRATFAHTRAHEYHPQGPPLIVLQLSSSFERARATRSPICHPPIVKMIEICRAKLSTAIFNSTRSFSSLQEAKNNIRSTRGEKI